MASDRLDQPLSVMFHEKLAAVAESKHCTSLPANEVENVSIVTSESAPVTICTSTNNDSASCADVATR
jgi:hypothetical protein